jgi:mitochondrial fission protein ELM1
MANPPSVWVLLGKGTGGNEQMRLLADALGGPCVEKHLVYDRFEGLPNLFRGATRLGLDTSRSDPLEPPWPDVVIGASRRSAPVSRYIKRRSGALNVHLLHVQAPLGGFDLIATLPQYRLPERSNVLHLSGALNRASPVELRAAGARWEPEFKPLPRPWIGLVVGGNSSSYAFDEATAARLGSDAADAARRAGGSLLVSTTPRTPPASAEVLFAEIDVPSFRYTYRANDDDNPYKGFLALADRFIVTVDSASLPMEACQTGRPVQVFAWPRKPAKGFSLDAREGRLAARVYEAAIAWGLVKPARDFDAYHRVLRDLGLTTRLDEEARTPAPLPDDLGTLVARIEALLAERSGARLTLGADDVR